MNDHLKKYLVPEAPNTVHYIPNFITETNEDYLMKQVYNAPKPKWTYLANRKLQDYGGIPTKQALIQEPIPTWLGKCMEDVSNLKVFGNLKANHCLVNEYMPGQGIMPHLDGPIFTPVITTISCGSHTILEFHEETEGVRSEVCKLLLERRSLVILQNDMYHKYLHSISELTKDTLEEECVNIKCSAGKYKVGDTLERSTRVSFTIRNVPKVAKCNIFGLLKK